MRTGSSKPLHFWFKGPPPSLAGNLEQTFGGYEQNWTMTLDLCQQKNVQTLHSASSGLRNMSTTRHLVPIFGVSKLSMSNDILIPSALDFHDSMTSDTSSIKYQDKAWENKVSGIVWRGNDSANPVIDSSCP
jgi:hypothetical protein